MLACLLWHKTMHPVSNTPQDSQNANILLSETYQHDNLYAISCPAVNSSGDVYHIAAYLILCKHFGWTIPHVYWGFDRQTTYHQAQRGIDFLNLLGFGKYAHHIETPTKSCYAVARTSAMRDTLNLAQTQHMDQRITTVFVREAYNMYGHAKIQAILRDGFVTQASKSIPSPVMKTLMSWIKSQTKKVRSWLRSSRKNQFVILHHRVSTTANDNQNLNSKVIKEIKRSFRGRSIGIFILYVCDEDVLSACPDPNNPVRKLSLHEYAADQDDAISVFDVIPGTSSYYDKWRHVKLLQEIGKTKGFIGVIGGTSGTLDVIAFTTRTFCLHTFADYEKSTSEKNKQLMRQRDYRICLQSNFMTICRNPLNDRKAFTEPKMFRQYLFEWLIDPAMCNGINLLIRKPVPSQIIILLDDKRAGKSNDRAVFQYLFLSHKCNDMTQETIQRKDSIPVSRISPYYHEHQTDLYDEITKTLPMLSLFGKPEIMTTHDSEPTHEIESDEITVKVEP